MPEARHAARVAALVESLAAQRGGAPLGLARRSSNLFRDRAEGEKQRLDLSAFTEVVALDTERGWVDVEGRATYEQLVAATLPAGVMPAVVPQLKTITVGGAIAGVAIEATSFRHGLVHETMRELEVLLPSGDVVVCTPDNAHADLFFGFPNSYGTLGYVLRARLATVPVKPFVRVEHERCAAPARLFAALAAGCADGTADFVDGVVFGRELQVASIARFVDEAPATSDYTFERIYYRSLPDTPTDWLTTHDYLWRWDTDWFWCSKNFGAQHPLVRRLLGPRRLNSATYTRWMRWNARWGLTRRLARWRGIHPESVIQDVDVPAEHGEAFLDFLLSRIGIVPLWICPIAAAGSDRRFPLYPRRPGVPYLNFGFWDVVESGTVHEPGHYNRLVEREVQRLGGIKSLYSDSYFTRDAFDATYGGAAYAALKARYDPGRRLLDLYDKCVLRR
ncbi:MAG: FAD-binding oxidoreductase [Lautropia sp.]